jgi:alpha-L-arabinofuranosidase
MPAAKIVLDPAYTVGPLNRRQFGSFVEHLGRCVYNGSMSPATLPRTRTDSGPT